MKKQPKTAPKKNNWFLPLILVVVIIMSVLYLRRGEDNSSTASGNSATSNALEPINATAAQKLASLDAISITRLPLDDKRVLKTDTLLNILSASYNEPPELIANATYVAHQQLKRMGKEMTHIAILEHMVMVPPKGMRYKQAVMSYIADVGK